MIQRKVQFPNLYPVSFAATHFINSMFKLSSRALVVFSLATFSGSSWMRAGLVSESLNHTGAPISWTVPSGVEAISVTLTGAQGGRGADDDPGVGAAGGVGGRVTGRLAVTPGEVLTFHLGSAGSSGSFASNAGGGAGGVTAAGKKA